MEPAIVDLFVRLEGALVESAEAFVVVTVDSESGLVAHATGPYTEAEQALVDLQRQDADWKAHAEPGEGDFSYVVVPLWKPTS